ncbi:UNVERIFIED_CONTAM: hypothetical protein PYX00_008876 [Menopon gallinae]|uniref:Peptidase S1 domain-containing protein n=1 Tax=Menopon gallinae TaxID=328185 RepID=A0AAW2H9A4_9NEOP
MARSAKLITTAVMVTMSLILCNAYSTRNITTERQPKKTVEIIELMLPRNKNDNGTLAEEEPRYEIFIKPNKNRYDSKGTPKIKIVVESDDYSIEKEHNSKGTSPHSDGEYYRAVPLSITSVGPNIDALQNKKTEKDQKLLNATGISPGIREDVANDETSGGEKRVGGHRAKHLPHTFQDGPKGVSVYGDGENPRPNEEREKRNRAKGFSSRAKGVETAGNASNPEHAGRRYEDVKMYGTTDRSPEIDEQRINASQFPRLQSHSSTVQSHATLPEESGGHSVGKILIYKPDTGISVAQVTSPKPKRLVSDGYGVSRRPEPDLDVGEARTTSIGRLPREGENSRSDGRRDGLSGSAFYDTRTTNTRQDGYRESVEGSRSDGHSDARKLYVSEDRHTYEREPLDLSFISSTGLPYEPVPQQKPPSRVETTTHRPVRDNSYLGFPESYSGSMHENSRPTSHAVTGSIPVSTCPTVFKYTDIDRDRLFAEVYLTTDEVLIGMRLDISLSARADLMTADSADVKTPDNLHFTVLSLKKRLMPGSVETVRLMVKYNEDKAAPLLQTISLNGRMICPSRSSVTTKATKKPVYVFPGDVQEQKRTTEPYNRPAIANEYGTTTRRTTSKPTTTTRRTVPDYVPAPNPSAYEENEYNSNRPATKKPNPNRPSFANARPNKPQQPPGLVGNHDNRRPIEESGAGSASANFKPPEKEKRNIPCGMPVVQPKPLITNGQTTSRGQWPWHAALYKNTGPNLNYSCGGTLVTDQHVVTAAHCVTREYTTAALDPKMLLVYLGKYHLYIWSENEIATKEVARVNVHPNYNTTDFRSDIAVLTLSTKVEFTDFIRPVCMWDSRNTRIEDIVGLQGTVSITVKRRYQASSVLFGLGGVCIYSLKLQMFTLSHVVKYVI